jgi:hypothetical protein
MRGRSRARELTMRVVGSIERVAALDRDGFEERFARPERPVVIAGAADAWSARARWSPDELARRLASVSIRYKASRNHRHPDFDAPDPAIAFATREASFAAFLAALAGPAPERWLFTGDEEYLLRARPGRPREVNPKLATLLDDFELPPYFDPAALHTIWTWFSAAGVRTWLHYDNNACHNLNAQIRGAKQCWLFPPRALGCFYPFELDATVPAHNCSRVDVERPDLARFPRFAEAECLEGELREGDLLFVPAFWFHTFLHTGKFNANVNFWWRPPTLRLNPVSRRWIWLKTLASALGDRPSDGPSPSAAQLAALPAETRDMLARIDRASIAAPQP